MSTSSDPKLSSILNKSGLDVFLEELKADLEEIKTTIKDLPTNERITMLESRVDSLESDRKWMVRAVVGAVFVGMIGMIFAARQLGAV